MQELTSAKDFLNAFCEIRPAAEAGGGLWEQMGLHRLHFGFISHKVFIVNHFPEVNSRTNLSKSYFVITKVKNELKDFCGN